MSETVMPGTAEVADLIRFYSASVGFFIMIANSVKIKMGAIQSKSKTLTPKNIDKILYKLCISLQVFTKSQYGSASIGYSLCELVLNTTTYKVPKLSAKYLEGGEDEIVVLPKNSKSLEEQSRDYKIQRQRVSIVILAIILYSLFWAGCVFVVTNKINSAYNYCSTDNFKTTEVKHTVENGTLKGRKVTDIHFEYTSEKTRITQSFINNANSILKSDNVFMNGILKPPFSEIDIKQFQDKLSDIRCEFFNTAEKTLLSGLTVPGGHILVSDILMRVSSAINPFQVLNVISSVPLKRDLEILDVGSSSTIFTIIYMFASKIYYWFDKDAQQEYFDRKLSLEDKDNMKKQEVLNYKKHAEEEIEEIIDEDYKPGYYKPKGITFKTVKDAKLGILRATSLALKAELEPAINAFGNEATLVNRLEGDIQSRSDLRSALKRLKYLNI